MKRAALLPILLCAAVGVVLHPADVFAQSDAHEVHLPFFLETVNPCNAGEPVKIEGFISVLIHTINDQSGGIHMKVYTTSRGQGFGLFDKYVYSQEDEQESYFGDSGTQVVTSVLNQLLVSASATNNFLMKSTLHVTVANGVPTPTVGNTIVECTG